MSPYLSDRYFVFGIIHPHWPSPNADLSSPFDLGAGVSLARVPEWLKDRETTRRLSFDDRRLVVRRSRLVLQTEIPVFAHGAVGKLPLYRASLALWLARPSHINLIAIAHAGHDDDHPDPHGWVLHCWLPVERLRPHPEYHKTVLTQTDLDAAKKLNTALSNFSKETTVEFAAWLLWSALTNPAWESRYVSLWVALEGLFGASAPGETVYRLANRIAMFLGRDGAEARELHHEVLKAYRTRSQIVHGRRLKVTRQSDDDAVTWGTEKLLQRSLTKILQSDGLAQSFEGRNRDVFLDDLVFRRLGVSDTSEPPRQ